jgi:hypothetical protein
MERQHFGDLVEAEIIRPSIIKPQKALIHSIYDVEHWRNGELLSVTRDHNTVTNEGLDSLLGIMFSDVTQITDWYVLIFHTDTTPSSTTTYAVPGFTESNATYDEATRPIYVEPGVVTQSITNTASKATFTMNATATIYGAALIGGGSAATTKGDTAGGGTMYCASQFAASKAVVDDDSLKVSITLTAADS